MGPAVWVNLKNKIFAIPVPTTANVATAAKLRHPEGCSVIISMGVVAKINAHGILTMVIDTAVIHGAFMWVR